MFDIPVYSVSKIFFTAIGVFIVWASWGMGRLSVSYLNTRLANLGLPPNGQLVVEFVMVVAVGVIVVITLVDPQTARQAIAAGMGWTGLIARPAATPRKG